MEPHRLAWAADLATGRRIQSQEREACGRRWSASSLFSPDGGQPPSLLRHRRGSASTSHRMATRAAQAADPVVTTTDPPTPSPLPTMQRVGVT
uniref:Uncharacterized protein n=1 Tax=Oryza meridionalis TaxID=40149 RepID=A0A0E0CP46_9ORYZ